MRIFKGLYLGFYLSEYNTIFLVFVNQQDMFVRNLTVDFCFIFKVGTDESQESSMTDADDTQLHAAESDEF